MLIDVTGLDKGMLLAILHEFARQDVSGSFFSVPSSAPTHAECSAEWMRVEQYGCKTGATVEDGMAAYVDEFRGKAIKMDLVGRKLNYDAYRELMSHYPARQTLIERFDGEKEFVETTAYDTRNGKGRAAEAINALRLPPGAELDGATAHSPY